MYNYSNSSNSNSNNNYNSNNDSSSSCNELLPDNQLPQMMNYCSNINSNINSKSSSNKPLILEPIQQADNPRLNKLTMSSIETWRPDPNESCSYALRAHIYLDRCLTNEIAENTGNKYECWAADSPTLSLLMKYISYTFAAQLLDKQIKYVRYLDPKTKDISLALVFNLGLKTKDKKENLYCRLWWNVRGRFL
jgi:hypothetical protein